MSLMPLSSSCSTSTSSTERSPTGINGLGRIDVYGARRVPRPPASTTALVPRWPFPLPLLTCAATAWKPFVRCPRSSSMRVSLFERECFHGGRLALEFGALSDVQAAALAVDRNGPSQEHCRRRPPQDPEV